MLMIRGSERNTFGECCAITSLFAPFSLLHGGRVADRYVQNREVLCRLSGHKGISGPDCAWLCSGIMNRAS